MTSKVDRMELMRLFVRIAETRSLSAAGQALGISQPSSSRQLRQLEAILGVQLIKRSTHDLTLTHAGEQFLPIAIDVTQRLAVARVGRIDDLLSKGDRLPPSTSGQHTQK